MSTDPTSVPDIAPEISTRVLSVFFRYFEHRYGKDRTEAAFAKIGGVPTLDYVLDPENFVSLEYCVRAAKVLAAESGDPGFIKSAGTWQLSSPSTLGFPYYLLRSLGTPRQYYALTVKLGPTFNRAGEMRIEKLTDTSLRMRYRSIRPEGTRLLCEGRLGQLAAAPTLWGLPPAEAREVECRELGAPECVYELTWAPSFRPVVHGLVGGLLGAGAGVLAAGTLGAAVGAPFGVIVALCLAYRSQSLKLTRHLADAAEGAARSLDALRERFEDVRRLHDEAEGTHLALERAEAALIEAQKLEALGRLSGGIAHDFNNALTVILNTADYLKVRSDDPVELRSGIQAIRSAALRAATLTRQLLAFSRTQVVEPRVIRLETHIDGLRTILARLVGEDVRVEVDLAANQSCVVVDPGQLERVLLNLAANARDAMPGGGSLRITTEPVVLGEGEHAVPLGIAPGRYVVLAVTDTGCGMDVATQDRVFEPFFTTKAVGKGTGLGLASTYGIIRQAHGAITVQSAPGKGATFRVYLPRVDAPPTASSLPPPVSLRRGIETVLVVDDDPMVREIVARSLRDAGYRVLVASDGDEALRKSQDEPGEIRLLVSDVVMPGMDGLALSERLREKRPHLRALFISGYPTDVLTRRGALPSEIHLLGKPFSDDELTGKVREVLEGRGPHLAVSADPLARRMP